MEAIVKGEWSLLDADGNPVRRHQKMKTRNHGDTYFVVGGSPPHHSGSTGRMYVVHSLKDRNCMDQEFFPGVFDCKWVKE